MQVFIHFYVEMKVSAENLEFPCPCFLMLVILLFSSLDLENVDVNLKTNS